MSSFGSADRRSPLTAGGQVLTWEQGPVTIEPPPDLPFAFGWNTSWCAVQCSNPERLVAELRLMNCRRTGWREGLTLAQNTNAVFVSPDVSGWTLIIGNSLPCAPHEECLELLANLSRVFNEAQYFGTSRVTAYHAWARSIGGRLRRAYAFSGEQGAILWDRGPSTREELDLGLVFSEDTILSNSPDDSSVFRLSGSWSIDPTQIETLTVKPGLGFLEHKDSGMIASPSQHRL